MSYKSLKYQCDAKCGRSFTTMKALHSHLSAAKSCSWYMKGKLRDLGLGSDEDEFNR
ncbi:hypothetical protein BDN70DRAFT_821307, partial [Pholiota conissans]